MSELRIDLKKQTMWIGDREYYYKAKKETDSDYDSDEQPAQLNWYKESTKYAEFFTSNSEEENLERIPIEEAEEIDHTRELWSPALDRIKDPEKLKELTRAFNKAEPREKAKIQEEKDVKEWLERNPKPPKTRGIERLSRASSDRHPYIFDWEVATPLNRYIHTANRKLRSGWWSVAENWSKRINKHSPVSKALRAAVIERKEEIDHERSEKTRSSSPTEKSKDSPKKESDVPKRTKWGVRVWSNDKKHYLAVGVWKSTKYEDCTTVRLSVAGTNYMYTLDKTQMETLRSELSRGVPT